MLNVLTSSSKVKNLDRYIETNFKKNVPNEKSWMEGGFGSLKLTRSFYESYAAVRIFRDVFGIKQCKVLVKPFDFESSLGREDNNNEVSNKFECCHSISNIEIFLGLFGCFVGYVVIS